MADRIVENYSGDVPDMPEVLQRVLVEALGQGASDLESGHDIVPFTMLVAGGNLFTERHPGDTTDACYASARHTVEGARGAKAYAFCYDGYLDTDEGIKDAVIAEGGTPGAPNGYAIGRMYTLDAEGKPSFNPAPSYIGAAPNFMEGLTDEPISEAGDESAEAGSDSAAVDEAAAPVAPDDVEDTETIEVHTK